MDSSGHLEQTTITTKMGAQKEEDAEEVEDVEMAVVGTRIALWPTMYRILHPAFHLRPLYLVRASSVTGRPMMPKKPKARRVGKPPQKEKRRMRMQRSASFVHRQSYTKLCLHAITGHVTSVPYGCGRYTNRRPAHIVG